MSGEPDAAADGPRIPKPGGWRLAAAFGAIPLLAITGYAGTFTSLLWLLTVDIPDAYDTDGEFGSAPNSWGETFGGLAMSSAATLLVTILLTAVVALLWFASTGRSLSKRAWVGGPAVLTALGVLAASGWLFAHRDEAMLATDCDEFRFDRAAFGSRNTGRWHPQVAGLTDCNALVGLTTAEVRAKLGPPDDVEGRTGFGYHGDGLWIQLERDRVVSAYSNPGAGP